MDKSRRYCLNCREVTTFKRKKKDKHSSCSKCGGFRAARRQDKKVKKQHRAKFKKIKQFFNMEE